jgi:hypothetical protein
MVEEVPRSSFTRAFQAAVESDVESDEDTTAAGGSSNVPPAVLFDGLEEMDMLVGLTSPVESTIIEEAHRSSPHCAMANS